MNSDADYSYSEQQVAYAPASPSIQIPFALLAGAICMFLIMQTQAVFRQKTALQENKKQFTEEIEKREPSVKMAAEIKKNLQALVMDIIILAKTDEDAKAIIAKYNIQQNIPGSSVDGPAPAPAPVP